MAEATNIVPIEKLADCVARTIAAINAGIATARDAGVQAELPPKVDFEVIVITDWQAYETKNVERTEGEEKQGGGTIEESKSIGKDTSKSSESSQSSGKDSSTSTETTRRSGTDISDSKEESKSFSNDITESKETTISNGDDATTSTEKSTVTGKDSSKSAEVKASDNTNANIQDTSNKSNTTP